jgi:serine/threonine protein kinase
LRYCPVCQSSYSDGVPFCSKDGQQTLALGTQEDPYIGKYAGSYQLTQKLGEGGMGVVYLAKHPTLGKRAAVKFLQTELNNKNNATERFFAEAQIVSQLGHENIVDVYDFGLLDGQFPFFVMEYLEGEPLSNMLAREQFIAPETAIDLTIQLLDALSVAHAHGVIHRDLKPDNTFLLPRRGRYLVKLLDFGIAKLRDTATKRLTKTGVLIGTPQYMSPEQVESEVELDGRADLYSVGILLYEMLCGRTPFSGNSLGIIALAHTMEPPPPPRSFRPELSPAIEVILLRSLEKDREARYQSAEEMIQALQSLQGQPLVVATDSIATPPGGSMVVNHSKAPSTNERTGARDNPFAEIRSGRMSIEEPPPTLATMLSKDDQSVLTSLYSNLNQPNNATLIGDKETQESAAFKPPRTPAEALPTMMTPIVSLDLHKTPPPTSGPNQIRSPGRSSMQNKVHNPAIPPTMMTPIVAIEEDLPTKMREDSLPTMMAPIVTAKHVDQEMPTMMVEIVSPKTPPLLLMEDLVTGEGGEANSGQASVVPFSAVQQTIDEGGGVSTSNLSKHPPLDAPLAKPTKESQGMTIAIALLSVLALILWALAFR